MFLRDLVLEWVKDRYPTHKWYVLSDGAGAELYAIYREVTHQIKRDHYSLGQAMIFIRGNHEILARVDVGWQWSEVHAADPSSFQKVAQLLESWQGRWS